MLAKAQKGKNILSQQKKKMKGSFLDNIYYSTKSKKILSGNKFKYINTDFGTIRVFDSGNNKPSIICVPDGPNVIEHQMGLVKDLSKDFRMICFEYPGLGFSYPSSKFNYSFQEGAELLFQLMDILKIEKTSLIFSCSNSFYALQAAMNNADKIEHIFISQTPSMHSMINWTVKSIPNLLKYPIFGQLTNIVMDKKLVKTWYKYSLPTESKERNEFTEIALKSIEKGGCFCLSSLVQNLRKDKDTRLIVTNTNVTMVWGGKDFTHRHTDKETIYEHVKSCEIIEFSDCGHFPELEQTTSFVKLVRERLRK